MSTRQYRPSKLKYFILPGLTVAFLGYFTYHAIHGTYGIIARTQMESKVYQLSQELVRLKGIREELMARVALMRADHLDQDMVDERARQELGFAHPDDVIIMRSDNIAMQYR